MTEARLSGLLPTDKCQARLPAAWPVANRPSRNCVSVAAIDDWAAAHHAGMAPKNLVIAVGSEYLRNLNHSGPGAVASWPATAKNRLSS